jgi:hypothetical protein
MTTAPPQDRSGEDAAWGEPHAQELHDDHARIIALVAALEAADAPAALAASVAELRPVLAAHFLEEESAGGFYEEVVRAHPRLSHTVDGLVEQHGTMAGVLEALDAALARAAAIIESALEDRDRLVDMIRRHERTESELLSAAWWTDLGEGD